MTVDFAYIEQIQRKQKQAVRSNPDLSIKERKELLLTLKRMIADHQDEWLAALQADLGKADFEGYATEIAVLLNEIDYMNKHLAGWLKVRSRTRLKMASLEKSKTIRRPYGSVLIISPWNYPLQLALLPVIGALACGNRCFLKPSEHTPATSAMLEKWISHYFANEWIQVVNGDADTSKRLLELKWDFILFTGSPAIGKSVYMQAAKHQTPVVLELGGKNPCIMDESGFTNQAIERIVWGKFLNAGQTCVAPDTLFVPESIYPKVLIRLREQIIQFYGEHPEASPDYSRIVHQGHVQRLAGYLEQGEIFYGGSFNERERYVAPTILTDVIPGSPVATDEIFGPILPVCPYRNLDELLVKLSEDDPLASYIFSKDEPTIARIAKSIRTTAIGVNEAVRHAASPRMPFGGVGGSGFGSYHGKASVDTFSYPCVMYKETSFLKLKQQFPPYNPKHLKFIKTLRRWLI